MNKILEEVREAKWRVNNRFKGKIRERNKSSWDSEKVVKKGS